MGCTKQFKVKNEASSLSYRVVWRLKTCYEFLICVIRNYTQEFYCWNIWGEQRRIWGRRSRRNYWRRFRWIIWRVEWRLTRWFNGWIQSRLHWRIHCGIPSRWKTRSNGGAWCGVFRRGGRWRICGIILKDQQNLKRIMNIFLRKEPLEVLFRFGLSGLSKFSKRRMIISLIISIFDAILIESLNDFFKK